MEFKLIGCKNVELQCDKSIVDNPKGVVVIVHGFAEHYGRYEHFVKKLNDAGFSVYRFDNRGHGRSGGKELDLEDYNDYIKDADTVVNCAIKENPNLPVFMYGHSMGGFITTIYGIDYPNKLKGQIISGAATDEPLQMNGFLRGVINFGYKAFPNMRVKNDLSAFLSRDNSVIEAYRKDPLVKSKPTMKFYKQFSIVGIQYLKANMSKYNYPCLIIHGKEDKIILYKSSENLYNSISSTDKTIKIYDNCWHELINEPEKEEVMEDIVSWLKERV